MGKEEDLERKRQKANEKGFGGQANPEQGANPLSALTFWWGNRLTIFAWKYLLEIQHLWNPNKKDTSEYIGPRVDASWAAQRKEAPRPHFGRALWLVFRPDYLVGCAFYAIYAASQFVGPEILRRMVLFVSNAQQGIPQDPNLGYVYAAILFGSSMVGSLCLFQAQLRAARVGNNMRTAIILNVFKKSLVLSNGSRAKTATGEIVNLMSNDAQRTAEVFLLLYNGIFAPAQIVVAIVLLYFTIGWSTFIGVGFMIIMLPTNAVLAKNLTGVRATMVRYIDGRIKAINEILQSMKVIKLYAWEDSFAQRVTEARDRELGLMHKFNQYRATMISLLLIVPTFVSLLVFSTYWGTGNSLQAANVFAAVSYLNVIRMPLAFLPMIVALYAQLKVAMDRITNFLLLEESTREPLFATEVPFIKFTHADFTWPVVPKKPAGHGGPPKKPTRAEKRAAAQKAKQDAAKQKGEGGESPALEKAPPASPVVEKPPFGLRDINLDVKGNVLVAIAGPVGSGKSSLCQALIREMDRTGGDSSQGGTIAYVAQQAWILNATIRDNILFGKPYDEARYNAVLEACALRTDLELFPKGDMVEIGDRGVNLSGGQKQRVSIARAVYADAQVYVLDDPLSAVDAHVGKHLFFECFRKALKDKLVILATNQLHFLPHVDLILALHQGQIAEQGSYSELVAAGKAFADLLEEYGVTKEDDVEGAEKNKRPEGKKKEVKEDEVKEEKKPAAGPSMEEERNAGAIGPKVYGKYFSAGSSLYFTFIMIMFILENGSKTLADYWLSNWINNFNDYPGKPLTNIEYFLIWLGIGIAAVIAPIVRIFTFFHFTVAASRQLHRELFESLLRAPMWFFDITPLGRILNRFARDMDQVDQLLPQAMGQWLTTGLQVICIIVIICIVSPILLAAVAVAAIIFYALQIYYRHTSRELQRIESISKSPIFNHFGQTLAGVASVRAYNAAERAVTDNERNIDENNKCYMTLQAMNQWIGLRLDTIGNLIIFLTAIIIVVLQSSVDTGSVGLSLSYVLTISLTLNRFFIQGADVETKMNSVERITYYIDGPKEAAAVADLRPEEHWPSKGSVEFNNVVMRYREGLDPVLRGITCAIKPQEKIGIVGRTGAGKSSIVLALFRLVELMEGSIHIDGVDISKLGLKDLRRNLSIIPQDPVLFAGTLRLNLDPFSEATDKELWDLLEDIQLKDTASRMGGLDCPVTENGDNWSVGQRQLICLGRALLRKPKILVLDEATASVDSATDTLIQRTVRTQFANCTILTIAHRLNTIMDSDRILVLDAGQIAEFESPQTLLENPKGLLTWLVNETGPKNARHLRAIAARQVSALGSPSFPNVASSDSLEGLEAQKGSSSKTGRRNVNDVSVGALESPSLSSSDSTSGEADDTPTPTPTPTTTTTNTTTDKPQDKPQQENTPQNNVEDTKPTVEEPQQTNTTTDKSQDNTPQTNVEDIKPTVEDPPQTNTEDAKPTNTEDNNKQPVEDNNTINTEDNKPPVEEDNNPNNTEDNNTQNNNIDNHKQEEKDDDSSDDESSKKSSSSSSSSSSDDEKE